MTDRQVTAIRVSSTPHPKDGEPRKNDIHAAATLDDTKFLVFCMVKTAKYFIALAAKRWPEAR